METYALDGEYQHTEPPTCVLTTCMQWVQVVHLVVS